MAWKHKNGMVLFEMNSYPYIINVKFIVTRNDADLVLENFCVNAQIHSRTGCCSINETESFSSKYNGMRHVLSIIRGDLPAFSNVNFSRNRIWWNRRINGFSIRTSGFSYLVNPENQPSYLLRHIQVTDPKTC